MTILIDAIHTLIISSDDGVLSLNKELADYLATHDGHVIVASNARGTKAKEVRDLLTDYSFEFFSLENAPKKSDPDYFVRVMMYYGLEPEECIYIDHAQENIDSARELGIASELYTSIEQAKTVIENFKTKSSQSE